MIFAAESAPYLGIAHRRELASEIHRDHARVRDRSVFVGNPDDGTVNYATARANWAQSLPDNVRNVDYVTEGALPAHASPQWNSAVYQPLVTAIQDEYVPLPRSGGSVRFD